MTFDHSGDDADLVLLFPGQGSQYYQMGRELFDREPVFRRLALDLDREFAMRHGRSLLDEAYGSRTPAEAFDNLSVTHPLLVLVEIALARTLEHHGLRPDALVGSSAGEFAAQAVAGRISVTCAFEMMVVQARAAQRLLVPGFLIAVTAALDSGVMSELSGLACFAGRGMPDSTLLAGQRDALPEAERMLRACGLAWQVLPVRVPFHSSLVEAMRNPWLDAFGGLLPLTPAMPVFGQLAERPGESYAASLWRLLSEPIDFAGVLAKLDPTRALRFVDVGPSGTLANWVRRSGRDAPAWSVESVLSPWGSDLGRLQAVRAGLPAVRATVAVACLP